MVWPLAWLSSRNSLSAGSRRSKKSVASTVSEIVEKGPLMKDGVCFQKIRRCPLCSLTNADDNVIKTGPRSCHPHLPWAQGTTPNPVGRLDKICSEVFITGGFADEVGGDVDAFVEKRKDDPSLNGEWRSSYATYVALVSDDDGVRLGRSVRDRLGEKLQLARKKSVQVYKKSQKAVKTKMRYVKRTKYEKQFPGRIARKGLLCKKTKIDGKIQEVVVLRVTPKDEWEVEIDDIQGVAEEEEIEDGELTLNSRQADRKFDAQACKTRFTDKEMEDMDDVDSQMSDQVGVRLNRHLSCLVLLFDFGTIVSSTLHMSCNQLTRS
jgi:hypothetical protein